MEDVRCLRVCTVYNVHASNVYAVVTCGIFNFSSGCLFSAQPLPFAFALHTFHYHHP